jgi:hypothetical protein
MADFHQPDLVHPHPHWYQPDLSTGGPAFVPVRWDVATWDTGNWDAVTSSGTTGTHPHWWQPTISSAHPNWYQRPLSAPYPHWYYRG